MCVSCIDKCYDKIIEQSEWTDSYRVVCVDSGSRLNTRLCREVRENHVTRSTFSRALKEVMESAISWSWKEEAMSRRKAKTKR